MRLRIRIMDRFLIATFLKLFTIFVLGAPLLFILGDITENLDRYLDRGVPFGQVLISYAYQYPQFVFWAFPIAALLATVFTIHPMTVHREVMAAKAGGISFHRLVAPLIVMGFLLTGVGLALAEVAPRANQVAAEMRGDRERQQAWRNNFVYITDSGESLSARRLTLADSRMVGVVLQDIPMNGEEPTRHVRADEAEFQEGRGWVLMNGSIRELYPDGRESMVRFDHVFLRSLVERPEDLMDRPRDEDEMTYAQLQRFGERLERSGGDVGRTYTKKEQRLAIPVATLIIVLFGAPLATSSRRGGTAFGIGISLVTTILYLMLFRFSGALGYAGTLDPRLAAWVPNLLFLGAGLVLLKRVRT